MDYVDFLMGCAMIVIGAATVASRAAVFYVAHRITDLMDTWQDRRR